jgi:subtilisin family serine protease
MLARSPLRSVTAALIALALSGCGGGGPRAAVLAPPTPVPAQACGTPAAPAAPPTARPGFAPTAAPSLAPSVYTFRSNPSGIAVSVGATAIGVTPVSTSPPYSSTPQTVRFGSGAGAYTVTIDQTANGPHTVYYNQVADTGSATLTGNQSVARVPASAAGEHRRFVRAAAPSTVAAGGLYVRYDAAKLAAQRAIAAIESDAGARGGADILQAQAGVRGRVIALADGADPAVVTANLQRNPAVLGVYPLHYRSTLGVTACTADDPYFTGAAAVQKAAACAPSCQWDMKQIRTDYAWSYTHGGSARIAVIDTGVDLTHPDLSPVLRYSAAAVQGILGTGTGAGGNSAAYGAAQDTNGHGTNVAAIAAADTNDNIGFAGTAYGTQLFAYRIFPPATSTSDQQQADTGDEALAITDAVRQGVDVINLSVGAAQFDASSGPGFDQAEHDAVEAAIAAGVIVVAAAGNDGATTINVPAAYDGVLAVGATSLNDGQPNGSGVGGGTATNPSEYVASYSNSGPGLGVVAPGGDPAAGNDGDYLHWIFNDSTSTAALPGDQCSPVTAQGDVCKSLFAGTSQATPHVAGAAALIQSALREHGLAPLSPAQMVALIEGTADNINDARQGHGRLNVLRALEAALGITPGTLAPSTSAPSQFVAFAYTNSGAVDAAPAIADVFYTAGVPVTSTGAFRIADIDPAKTTAFKVGVWLDANGDGRIDAGDQFGAAAVTCTATAPCAIGTVTVAPITRTGFALP